MDEKTMPLSSSATHLGILRSESREKVINIEQRLSLSRRTLYALINKGLNPKVAFKIYQCCVISRLLYGLEVLPLDST